MVEVGIINRQDFEVATNVLGNQIAVANENQYVGMNQLRQQVAGNIQDNHEQAKRIGGNANFHPSEEFPQIEFQYWLQGEDLGRFAQFLGRPIVLQAAGIPNATIYRPNGTIETGLFDQLVTDGNCILIYHDGVNHFQAIKRNDS
ncbi:MAG: hypothetical protein LBE99_01940 [Puniceicoccales bacterium]|jgi:hypothetical protein|nr:hypothetical protein [Puniceicoccales bacterium]